MDTSLNLALNGYPPTLILSLFTVTKSKDLDSKGPEGKGHHLERFL